MSVKIEKSRRQPIAEISCQGKQAFETVQQARQVGQRMMRKRKAHNLLVYACTHCGQFHLGNSNS